MNKKEGKRKHSKNILTGKLDITRSGIGYVIPEDGQKDIFIRPHDFNKAFDGDTVKVALSETNGKRAEGKVLSIVERKQTEFIGNISISETFGFFTPDSKKPMPDFYINTNNFNGAKNSDRVVVKLIAWEDGEKKPEGAVVSVLHAKDMNDMAMKEILIQNGFPIEFSAEVMGEASQLSEAYSKEVIEARRDFRGILTFTIDPIDAKDFDDALSIRVLPNGNHEIGIHIADVSHFVQPGTALDQCAYDRATSVYLPDRVNPMLPERISNELCSLRPHEDKLTFSAIFEINSKGHVKNHWLGKTIIHSDHRFTYEDVQQIIDSKQGEHNDEIIYLNGLAQQYRIQRFKSGAINFSSSEVKFTLDENGKPTGITVKESKESHQLIEEFMLLANRTVAEDVAKIRVGKHPLPFPYRIHDKPDEEKLKPFVAFARKFGYKFDLNDEAAIAASFNQMLIEVKGKPEQHVLEQLGIRTMAKAIYTSDNIGHYGLGFKHYCHFTSPIRRYPDIMVHRVLEDILGSFLVPDKKMEEKCRHCSAKERSAMEAERAGNKYKQVEYMQDYLGEDFEGVINGVSSFGFWVETITHKCEGLVSIRDMSDIDDFRLDDTDYSLVGTRTGRRFRIGDIVTIKVVSANLAKRQMDYEWIPKVNDEIRNMTALTSPDQELKTIITGKGHKVKSRPTDNFKKFRKKRKKK